MARALVDGRHVIGSHGHYHARMSHLTDEGIADDVQRAEEAIRQTCGVDPRPWFRCPFGDGASDPRVLGAIAAAGYRHVGWHVDGEDWAEDATAEGLERRVREGIRGTGDGAVVLLHGWPAATPTVVERLLASAADDGVAYVGIDELGVTPVEIGAVVVLAVDGGNSKTDVALVADDGALLAAVRGPTVSHQAVGLDEGMARLERLARDVGASVDGPADVAVFALAGADYPSDVRLLRRGIERLGIAREVVVVNDTLAALRAGSRRPWGIALICGQGVNGVGVAPDGRVARFDGVGDISGDWGGGTSVGLAAQAAAVRARDGRGPRTSLEKLVPAHFGLASPAAVVRALYTGRIDGRAPRGAVAGRVRGRGFGRRGRSARSSTGSRTSSASWRRRLIRRLRLGRLDPDVVLAGGVFRAEDPAFHRRLAAAVADAAPDARVVRLEAPPVLGSALLGLERLAGEAVAEGVAERLAGDLAAIRDGPRRPLTRRIHSSKQGAGWDAVATSFVDTSHGERRGPAAQ